jgi:hypothetical protein
VSSEALIRIESHPRLKSKLLSMKLPPKLLEIDGEVPTSTQLDLSERNDARVERLRSSLMTAAFTGKADRPTVIQMLDRYVDQIATAMYRAGEGGEEQYTGEYNGAGEAEGHGNLRDAEGGIYDGGFKGGKKHGKGTLRAPDGAVYEGGWKAGEKEGGFTIRFPDGSVELCRFHEGTRHGLAVRWSADRRKVSSVRHAPLIDFDMEPWIVRQLPSFPRGVHVLLDFVISLALLPLAIMTKLVLEALTCLRVYDRPSEISQERAEAIAQMLGLPVPVQAC